MSQLLKFDTLHNTRDLGGMLTADGHRIKSGKLIRSGRLSDISPQDKETLSGLLDTVIDFRDADERAEYPDAELDGVAFIHLPILEKLAVGVTKDKKSEQEVLAMITKDPGKALKTVCGIYTRFVADEFSRSQYRVFLKYLLETHEKAVLWHCSGGKDRAGIGSVIVEEILGVSRDAIIADYMKTNDYLSENIKMMMEHTKQKLPAGVDISNEALECLFCAKREYIDTFYQTVEQKYGSIRTFLLEGLQMTEEDISHMKEMYLE